MDSQPYPHRLRDLPRHIGRSGKINDPTAFPAGNDGPLEAPADCAAIALIDVAARTSLLAILRPSEALLVSRRPTTVHPDIELDRPTSRNASKYDKIRHHERMRCDRHRGIRARRFHDSRVACVRASLACSAAAFVTP